MYIYSKYLGNIHTFRQGKHLVLKILKIILMLKNLCIYIFHKQNVYPTGTVLYIYIRMVFEVLCKIL